MITFVHCLRRRAQHTREAFQRWWFEEHGALMAGHRAVRGERRYAQLHAVEPSDGPFGGPYDGFTLTSFDSIEAWEQSQADPAAREVVEQARADHAAYIDPERSLLQTATECRFALGDGRDGEVVLVRCVRRLLSLDCGAFQRRWLDHASSVERRADAISLRGYEQHHTLADWDRELTGGSGPQPYDGFELWRFDDLAAWERAFAADVSATRLPDFADATRSDVVVTRERVIFDDAQDSEPAARGREAGR